MSNNVQKAHIISPKKLQNKEVKDSKKDLSKFFGVSSPTTRYAIKKEQKPVLVATPKPDSSFFLGIADNDDELDNFTLEVNK